MKNETALPEDLSLITRAFENGLLPAIRENNFFEAQATIENILAAIDLELVRREHCGMNLISSLKGLGRALEKEEPAAIESTIERVRAFLAQAQMYH